MQKINLYLEEFKEKRVPFSIETLMFFFFGSMMFCFMGAVVIYILYVSSAAHIKMAKKELLNVQDAFERAKTEFNVIEKDVRLQSRIEQMKQRQQHNTQLLEYLTQRSLDAAQQSFSNMLTALTKVQETGLWLTEVHFEKSGNGLSLTGLTGQPERVPSYINKLGKTEAFAGMQFKVFDMKRENGVLAFTLSSQRMENESNEALLEVLGETVQSTQVK